MIVLFLNEHGVLPTTTYKLSSLGCKTQDNFGEPRKLIRDAQTKSSSAHFKTEACMKKLREECAFQDLSTLREILQSITKYCHQRQLTSRSTTGNCILYMDFSYVDKFALRYILCLKNDFMVIELSKSIHGLGGELQLFHFLQLW
jgi:hypothetical protein